MNVKGLASGKCVGGKDEKGEDGYTVGELREPKPNSTKVKDSSDKVNSH